ncbi:MAG: hypothetical protein AAFQ94_17365 [Bacteroidota bacterium]
MSDVKQRGPQYFLLVVVVLAVIIVGNFLKPKSKAKTEMKPKVMASSKKEFKKQEPEFEKILPSKNEKTDSLSMMASKDTMPIKIDQWYQELLKQYTSEANDLSGQHDVVIRYYRKPKDENRIDSLRVLGFYIHERPTKKQLQQFHTNTIYYGDSVRREDVMVVAYQLKMAGFKLQAVEHSRFGDNWKSHSIELGTDTTMLTVPELSLDTIRYIVENNPYIKTRM